MTDAGIIIGSIAFLLCVTSQVSFAFYRYYKKEVICPVDVIVNRINKHGCLVCAKTSDECLCTEEENS